MRAGAANTEGLFRSRDPGPRGGLCATRAWVHVGPAMLEDLGSVELGAALRDSWCSQFSTPLLAILKFILPSFLFFLSFFFSG